VLQASDWLQELLSPGYRFFLRRLGFSDLPANASCALAGLNQSSMLKSNPLNVSSYATARPQFGLPTSWAYTQSRSTRFPWMRLPWIPTAVHVRQRNRLQRKIALSPSIAKMLPMLPLLLHPLRRSDTEKYLPAISTTRIIATTTIPMMARRTWFASALIWKGNGEKFFSELRSYCDRTANCCVPQSYTPNDSLARWVTRQRYQYELKIDGKSYALGEIGFIWC
jgi:hypothetical protein